MWRKKTTDLAEPTNIERQQRQQNMRARAVATGCLGEYRPTTLTGPLKGRQESKERRSTLNLAGNKKKESKWH